MVIQKKEEMVERGLYNDTNMGGMVNLILDVLFITYYQTFGN